VPNDAYRLLSTSPPIVSSMWMSAHGCNEAIRRMVSEPVYKEAGYEALTSQVKLVPADIQSMYLDCAVHNIEDFFGLPPLSIEPARYVLYETGAAVRAHTDEGNNKQSRLLTAILYLNDNYADGELVFPTLALALKPKAGQFIIFPSLLLHEVRKITSGCKHIFVTFKGC